MKSNSLCYKSQKVAAFLGLFLMVFLVGTKQIKAQYLAEYQQLAGAQNPGLQAQYKAFEIAMQKVAQQGNLPDPTFSFGYFISPVETRVGPQRAKFSLAQMFPWFGTLKLQKTAATATAEANYQTFLDAKNQLFYEVASAYFPLYELQKRLQLEQENLRILTSYKSIAQSNFENGKGALVEVLRVELLLEAAQTELTILAATKKSYLTRFNKLLNISENEVVNLPDTLMLAALPTNYRRDSLWVQNPRLEGLEQQMNAAKVGEQLAIKQGMPKIGAGLDYVVVGQRTDMDLPQNGKDVFMPMVSVSLPIGRGKYLTAEKEAQLQQAALSLQVEELTNQLTVAYEQVWLNILTQQERYALYQKQAFTAEQSLSLLLVAYSNGSTAFEKVLDMQQQLLNYQKKSLKAITEWQMAVAKLHYLTSK